MPDIFFRHTSLEAKVSAQSTKRKLLCLLLGFLVHALGLSTFLQCFKSHIPKTRMCILSIGTPNINLLLHILHRLLAKVRKIERMQI